MSSTLIENKERKDDDDTDGRGESRLGGQMSFLEHLDELRRRLIRAVLFIALAFVFCFYFSNHIYNFLSVPVRRALADAQLRTSDETGPDGARAFPLQSVEEGYRGRYVFPEATRLVGGAVPAGATVQVIVRTDESGRRGVYTDEPLIAGTVVIPSGVRLPLDFQAEAADALPGAEDKLIVTTAMEPFSLYLQVALYAAIALSVPVILWQIWAFIAPGLYPHERGYALPFVLLSSISFVAGAAFAYYVLFPPAAAYLLGLGSDFRLLLKATDYFDFIVLIMLAMGIVFQMPAVTYVLSRIGLVTAGLLLRSWRISTIVILAAAAVLSPTNDVLNMMLFAAPMVVLYMISIFIAWMFGRPRRVEE